MAVPRLAFPRNIPYDSKFRKERALLPEPSFLQKLFIYPGKTEFVSSVDVGLIQRICAIRCTNKECKTLLIHDISPQTGYCGHLFCFECARTMRIDFRARLDGEYRQNRGINAPSFTMEAIAIAYPGMPVTNTILYYCNGCEGHVMLRQETEYFRLFITNLMLTNLYVQLERRGYYCAYDGCLHPPENTLVNLDPSADYPPPVYTCVWHARTQLNSDLVHPRPQDRANLVANGPLASLEPSVQGIFAVLYHCANCGKRLPEDRNDRDEPPSHLECGHLVGSRCVPLITERGRNPRNGVFCVFCYRSFPKLAAHEEHEAGNEHLLYPSTQLYPIVSRYEGQLQRCKVKSGRLHPSSNMSGQGCKWCTIEKTENSKNVVRVSTAYRVLRRLAQWHTF